MKPDLVLQYCVFCDYPVYRSWIKKYRDKFNKIIIYPSRHHGVIDLEKFAKETIEETWVDPVEIDYGIQDWRQAETEPLLKHIESDWIYFSEQDFFVKDWDKFFKDIEKASKYSDAIGLWNPTHFPYLHPSCFLIKREIFDKTQKDFKAHSEINGADHFSMLTRDLEKLGAKITTLQDLGYEEWRDMFHLGGLTYVYQNFKEDFSNPIGVKRPEVFYIYNYMQRLAPVKQNEEFLALASKVDDQLQSMHLNITPKTYEFEDFFKI